MDRLDKPNTHKSMGPDGRHPRVLRELAGVVALPFSIIFEYHGEQERCLMVGGRPMLLPFSKRAGSRTQKTTGQSASPLSLER